MHTAAGKTLALNLPIIRHINLQSIKLKQLKKVFKKKTAN